MEAFRLMLHSMRLDRSDTVMSSGKVDVVLPCCIGDTHRPWAPLARWVACMQSPGCMPAHSKWHARHHAVHGEGSSLPTYHCPALLRLCQGPLGASCPYQLQTCWRVPTQTAEHGCTTLVERCQHPNCRCCLAKAPCQMLVAQHNGRPFAWRW